MRLEFAAALCTIAAFLSTGCVSMVTPAANVVDLDQVDLSRTYKSGRSCQTYVSLFGPFGNASVIHAARNGKISKAMVVDYETRNYLVFEQFCTIVHGE